MKRKWMLLVGMVAGVASAEPSAAPRAVFDGKSLAGWRVDGAGYWRVEGGLLIGESAGGADGSILWTESRYRDFEFSVEFRYEGEVDSGVFLRRETDQIQIGTSRTLKRDMTGSPYMKRVHGYPQEAEGVAGLLRNGEWNRLSIVVRGPRYEVRLNGREVLVYTSETAVDEGPIGLQVHEGLRMKIEFREICVRPLDGD